MNDNQLRASPTASMSRLATPGPGGPSQPSPSHRPEMIISLGLPTFAVAPWQTSGNRADSASDKAVRTHWPNLRLSFLTSCLQKWFASSPMTKSSGKPIKSDSDFPDNQAICTSLNLPHANDWNGIRFRLWLLFLYENFVVELAAFQSKWNTKSLANPESEQGDFF